MTAKPCLDCRQITTAGSRCQACTAAHEARQAEKSRLYRASAPLSVRREHERRRGTRTERGYSNAWLAIVRQAIREQPYCSVAGCTRTDLTGDHLIPLSMGGESVRENVRVLCRFHNTQRGNRLNWQPRG